ncbi:MAG: SHOCT domain-containing protein [Gaiellaceae bacterium]
MVAQLEKLAGLKDKGILTQEEFDAQKQKLLGGS